MSGDPRPVGEDDLHGLIDGRLEPERQALVEAWLRGNPARAAEVSADRALRERLRARLAPIAERRSRRGSGWPTSARDIAR